MSEPRGFLAAIVHASLRYRAVTLVLAVLLLVAGGLALARSSYDVFPEFAPPQVVVQTEAAGLDSEQVEVLVTQPLENAINGMAGLESLRSQSIQGLSVIIATFEPGTDIYHDRQAVSERLATAATTLPNGVAAPAMSPMSSSTSMVMAIGLTSKQRSLMELRSIANWRMKPALLAVPGVSKINIFGGDERELQIQLLPDRLVRYDIGIEDVTAAAQKASGVRGAGFIETANQRISIKTRGQTLTPAQLAATVVKSVPGGNVTLGDLARVVEAPSPAAGAATINGEPGLQLVVSEQYGANSLEVTRRIEDALKLLAPELRNEGIVLHSDLFRPASFITTATDNVRNSLLIGGALVVVVLFLFLANVRTALISLVAIPLSLLAAVSVMHLFGLSLNTMTLGGLAIAVGLLVDDAVIMVENIHRRLRENANQTHPRWALPVVLDAALEVRSAVVYATLAIALVFIPVLTMSGVSGRLFAPLGTAYLLATLASLLVALTVTPALCLGFLRSADLAEYEPRIVRWMRDRYAALLSRVDAHWRAVLAGVAALMVLALLTLPFLKGGFLPELKEGHYIVHMAMAPGSSLEQSVDLGSRVSHALARLPSVRSVAQRAGRAELADDTYGPNYSELDVAMKPLDGEGYEVALHAIRETLAGFPGASFSVNTFLSERVDETLSGYIAAVTINLYGRDLDAMDASAADIAAMVSGVHGAADVQVQSAPGAPELTVNLRPQALARWGLASGQVLEAVQSAYQGAIAGQVYQGNQVTDIRVILNPDERNKVSAIGGLPIHTPSGAYVPLRELADIHEDAGRYVVLHTGARRVQTITANVNGRSVSDFVNEVDRKIRGMKLPEGSYVEFGGTAQAQAQSTRDLLLSSALAGIALVLLLSIVLGNGRNLGLVLINMPFALIGGLLAVFVTGGAFSVGAMVGFVTLFGITLRNSVMLLSHYQHLVEHEGAEWNVATARRGAQERLTPILMTAIVTALGLLPLAVGSGEPGREIEGPMALVILGGLFTSTALNLLVMPALAMRYGRFGRVTENDPPVRDISIAKS
ncbi:MAG: efflux RND transporter permease subunit [Xanthomonadaceae bacterium]|nr:efflux RND transporter permease subunit [Xanthomonadaceae bacterium]